MRKQFTATFKAKFVLELLKEQKSLSQLAAEHKVHPNVLRQWRDAALKELPMLFDKKDHSAEAQAAHERCCRRTLRRNRTPHDAGRVAQKK